MRLKEKGDKLNDINILVSELERNMLRKEQKYCLEMREEIDKLKEKVEAIRKEVSVRKKNRAESS